MHNDTDIWMQIHEFSTDGFSLMEAVRDHSGTIIDFITKYINESGARMVPENAEELVGQRLTSVRPENLTNGMFDHFKHVVETGKPYTGEQLYLFGNIKKWYRLIVVKVNDGVAITFSDISVQKELESQLRENESYLRKITESIPQLVWITRPDGYHEYYNDRWYEYTGTTLSETSGIGWNKVLHPGDQKIAMQRWKQSLKSGEPYEIEYRLKNGKTQEYRWFLARALPIRNDQGVILKWFGTCTDIHSQRIAADSQKFLADASKLLSASLDYKKVLQKVAELAVPHISDWISMVLYDGQTIEHVALAHVDKNKVKWGRKLQKDHPTDMSENTGLPQVLKTGEPLLYPIITEEMIQASVKDPDELALIREIGFTSLIIVPITVHKKTIGAIQFVSTDSKKQFSDIDLQMAQELAGRISLTMQNAILYDEIRQRERQFQALYDSNIIGVVYSDLNGVVRDANDAFFAIIGYTREDFDRKRIPWEYLSPVEFTEIDALKTKELLDTGVATPFEKEYLRKDGSQVPVIIGIALLDKKKQSCIAFILDITERKKLEHRKDEFLGIASHELKTPLTSIKGYVQILERIIQEMGDDKASALVDKTNTYIDKLDSLIVDLLDVSKIQSGKLQFSLEQFDFSEIVAESVHAIQPTTLHKITLQSTVPAFIEGDHHRLEQVMSNLLTNAIKYSPLGKEIIISMSKNESFVQVNVQDFGIGIEKQYQRLLFQRFYRVEASARQFSGLGIGLYISSEIITRHGGRIWLDSTPGVGSTFHFTLPLIRN